MEKNKIFFAFFCLFVFIFLFMPFYSPVYAICIGPVGCETRTQPACTDPCRWSTGEETHTASEVVPLPNPLANNGTSPTPSIIIGKVINEVLGLVGSVALAIFVYGGFVWMLAAGNNERVQKGKDILIWAVIGLVVIFSAYALVKLIFTGIGVT